MPDPQTTLGELKALVQAFSRERDWEQFHHPKDLGVALACEVGEVLEHFRYRSNEAIATLLDDPDQRREVAHELADCLWLLLRLADVCRIDLAVLAPGESRPGGDQIPDRPGLRPRRQIHGLPPP